MVAERAVLVAGRLRSMDPQWPIAEAMITVGDRIVALGDLAGLRASHPEADLLDLGDAVVLPGLIDTHFHLQRGGLKLLRDGGGRDVTLAEFLELMSADWDVWDGEPTLDDRVEGLRLVQPLVHALGITGVIDPAVTPEEMAGYQAARERGVLGIRVTAMPYPDVGTAEEPDIDGAIARLRGIGVSTGFGDEGLRIGGIKVYFDGEGTKSEALLDQPWPSHGGCGVQRIPTDGFDRLTAFCVAEGWSMGMHAVGAAAIRTVLEALNRAAAAAGLADLAGRGFQIIHGYLEPTSDAMALAARLGVLLSAQPSIAWINGVKLANALGEQRVRRLNPLRSWTDAGVTVVLGSDGPFFPFDPRHLMATAIDRRVAGRAEPLDPREALTAGEALAAYTRDAAAAAFSTERGVLRPGALADWTALAADPLEIGPEELRRTAILRTVVGGRTVFGGTQ